MNSRHTAGLESIRPLTMTAGPAMWPDAPATASAAAAVPPFKEECSDAANEQRDGDDMGMPRPVAPLLSGTPPAVPSDSSEFEAAGSAPRRLVTAPNSGSSSSAPAAPIAPAPTAIQTSTEYRNSEITAWAPEPPEAAAFVTPPPAGTAGYGAAASPSAAATSLPPLSSSATAPTSLATGDAPPPPPPPPHHARHADLSDVPLDVLSSLILPRLPPGHRLDVRAVSRRWAAWVDGGLAPATHINLVMDRKELAAAAAAALAPVAPAAPAARSAVAVPSAAAAVAPGQQLPYPSSQQGLLDRRFPSAVAARLWVGCRPPASVAGTNGGGLAAQAAAETAAAAAPHAAGSQRRGVAPNGRGLGSTGPLQGLRPLSSASFAAAMEDCCSRAAGAPGRIAAGIADLLLASSSCVFPMTSAAMRRRLGGGGYGYGYGYYGGSGAGGGGGAAGGFQPSYRWHVHTQKLEAGGGSRGRPAAVRNADGTFQLLRRYSQDALEPQALPPLPQCLPLLGGSTALRRLSVVSAYDMSTETLALLAAAFPNLTALSLHAHHAPGVDATPVHLRHSPGATMISTSLTEARAAAAAANTSASRNLASFSTGLSDGAEGTAGACNAPRASAAADASAGASDDASGGGAAGASLGRLRRRHSDNMPESVAAAAMAATAGEEVAEQPRWVLRSPLVAGLPQLQTLALCGLRLGDAEAQVLGALGGLRALVLHRVTCRVHRLLPHLEAGLTRLTRLELRRLDYFRSLPPDPPDTAALEARERRRAAADASRGGVNRHAARHQRQLHAATRRAARLAARRRPHLLTSLLGRGTGSGTAEGGGCHCGGRGDGGRRLCGPVVGA